MNTEILGVAVQIVLMVVLAYPLGRYIARVYKGEKTWSDFMAPIERVIYKICGINPQEEMNWKQFLKALLILNAFGLYGEWCYWYRKVGFRSIPTETGLKHLTRHSILASVLW